MNGRDVDYAHECNRSVIQQENACYVPGAEDALNTIPHLLEPPPSWGGDNKPVSK